MPVEAARFVQPAANSRPQSEPQHTHALKEPDRRSDLRLIGHHCNKAGRPCNIKDGLSEPETKPHSQQQQVEGVAGEPLA